MLSSQAGRNWALCSLYRQRFPKYGPIFKPAMLGHETWPLLKVTGICTYTLFLPKGIEIELIFTPRVAVLEIWANFIFGSEIWNLKKGPKVEYVLSFYPRGVANKLIFALRSAVFETWPNFQISIFGHEIWNLKKGPKVAYVLSFYRGGGGLSIFSLYGQPFLRFSNFPYLGMESGIWRKVPKLLLSLFLQPFSK